MKKQKTSDRDIATTRWNKIQKKSYSIISYKKNLNRVSQQKVSTNVSTQLLNRCINREKI